MTKRKIIGRKGNSLTIKGNTFEKPFTSSIQPMYDTGGIMSMAANALGKFNTRMMDEEQFKGAWDSVNNALSKFKGGNSKLSGLWKDKGVNILGGLGKAAGIGGSALGIGSAVKDAYSFGAATADPTSYYDTINNDSNYIDAGTINGLQENADNLNQYSDVTQNSQRGHTTGEIVGNTALNMGKAIISTKGGIFAKLGAAAGVLGAGVLGGITGSKRAARQANAINYAQDESGRRSRTALGLNYDNINSNLYEQDMLYNYPSAFGGKLKKRNKGLMSKNLFAYGGDLQYTGDFNNGVTYINEGGTHEESPIDGVPVGFDNNGIPNLVEEGEVIYNDYVFSNRLSPREKELEKGLLHTKYKDHTFAKAAELIAKESEEMPNDRYALKTLDVNLGRLREIQETQKARKAEAKAKREFASLPPELQVSLYQNAQNQMQNQIAAEQQAQMSQMMPQEGITEQPMQNPYDEQMAYTNAFGGNIFAGPDEKPSQMNINRYPYENDWTSFIEAGLRTADGSAYTDKYTDQKFQKWIRDNYDSALKQWWNADNSPRYWSKNNVAPTIDYLLGGTGTSSKLPGMYDNKYSDAHRFGAYAYGEYQKYLASEAAKKADVEGEARIVEGNPDSISADDPGADIGAVMRAAKLKSQTQAIQDAVANVRTAPVPDLTDASAAIDAQISSEVGDNPVTTDTKTNSVTPQDTAKRYATWMRYAPVIGSAFSVANDVFGGNNPYYGNADLLMAEARRQRPVRFNPIGNYLTYKPLDRNYYLNQMTNSGLANARALTQAAGVNRGTAMAGLIANGYNQNNTIGNGLMQMEQYNMGNRAQVSGFNRDTDKYNSEGQLRADVYNMSLNQQRMAGLSSAVQMREAERLRNFAERSANLTNLFDNIGNVGKENMSFNMVNSNRSQYYGINRDGSIYYKPAYYALSDDEKAQAAKFIGRKNGGYLTLKKSKRK